jgi:type IV pilus assembly protein PilC
MELPHWIAFRNAPETVGLFYRQLSVLMTAGIPLNDSLICLAENPDERFSKVVETLQQRIANGSTLSAAMLEHPMYFGLMPVGMVRAAESSGALVATLERLANLSERTTRLKKKVGAALTYPAVQFLCILSVVAFFVLVLAPDEEGLFSVLGGELPWPSRVLIHLSKVLKSPVILCAVGIVPLAAGWLFQRQLKRSPQLRLMVDGWILHLPVFGTLVRQVAAVSVVDTMESMVSVGIPALKAITLSEKVVGNEAIKFGLQRARSDIQNGDSIGQAFARNQIFDSLVASMIEVGEESGRLDQMLRLISRRLDEDVELALESMVKLIEPILLCIAGVAAGFVALAGLMPLMNMISKL